MTTFRSDCADLPQVNLIFIGRSSPLASFGRCMYTTHLHFACSCILMSTCAHRRFQGRKPTQAVIAKCADGLRGGEGGGGGGGGGGVNGSCGTFVPSCFALQVPDVRGWMLQRDVKIVTELYLECKSVSGHAHWRIQGYFIEFGRTTQNYTHKTVADLGVRANPPFDPC